MVGMWSEQKLQAAGYLISAIVTGLVGYLWGLPGFLAMGSIVIVYWIWHRRRHGHWPGDRARKRD